MTFPTDVPKGSALYNLLRDLHGLHARAGWPGTRQLQKPGQYSHAVVHQLFTKGKLPRYPVLMGVVEKLGTLSPADDADDIQRRLGELWEKANEEDEAGAFDRPSGIAASSGTVAIREAPEQPRTPERPSKIVARELADAFRRHPDLPSVNRLIVDLQGTDASSGHLTLLLKRAIELLMDSTGVSYRSIVKRYPNIQDLSNREERSLAAILKGIMNDDSTRQVPGLFVEAVIAATNPPTDIGLAVRRFYEAIDRQIDFG